MRFSEIYEAELGKRNYFREYKDIVLPAVSNALTTAAIYPFFSATLASYGLPVAGMTTAVLVSAAIGLGVGTLVYNMTKKNRRFATMYSEFTQMVFYRDVLFSVGNRLPQEFKAEYRVATIDPRSEINKKMHKLGTDLIDLIDSSEDVKDGNVVKERINSAYLSPKTLPTKVMEEVMVTESAIVVGLKAIDAATKYLRLTGTSRTKKAIQDIEHTQDVGKKLIQYRKLQEYVAWDFVEGRTNSEEFYKQTLWIQTSISEIKKNERFLPF